MTIPSDPTLRVFDEERGSDGAPASEPRPLREVRANVPQSVYSEREQRIMMLRGRADFYRQEAARLRADANRADAKTRQSEAELARLEADAAE